MLSTVFSRTLPVKERLDKLENEFGITVTEKIRKEVTDMCNLSQGIRNDAVDETKKETAERMIRDGALPDEKIAQYSGLTLSQIKTLREEMKTAVMA